MLESPPFALSLSKGILWFDRLTTNGMKTPAIVKHDKVKIINGAERDGNPTYKNLSRRR